MTARIGAGTQMSSLRCLTADTTASATSSGVTASGASSRPSVILERTKPGRTTSTPTPLSRSASPSPRKNPSSPALVEPYTKFERRTRSPATLDSATILPCPWARSRFASSTPRCTGAV